MNKLDIPSIITALIEAGNAYDTAKYLSFYQQDAILDDPSVGCQFEGHTGIREYFEEYFIGYQTQTALRKLNCQNNQAYVEVQFTGNFPGGIVTGTFDFQFTGGKISAAKADLM